MPAKTSKVVLMAGTKKGLFVFTSGKERARWKMSGPHLKGQQVFHAVLDARTGRMFAAGNSEIYGPEISHSDDIGETWTESKTEPRFAGKGKSVAKLARIWHIEPGRNGEKGVVYAGGEPACLFRSEDNGRTWREIESLRKHPTAKDWQPGNGGLCLHTVLLDPQRPGRIYAGISAVGLFRSDDAGETWVNKNDVAGLVSKDLRFATPCVHKAGFDPRDSRVIYQQNHSGVFKTKDAGESWSQAGRGLPSEFGFPLAVHPRKPGTFFTVPMGGEMRNAPDGKFKVWRTDDSGKTWEGLSAGLPQKNAWLGCLREGLAVDGANPLGVYAGTNTGQVYYSRDEGDSWHTLADKLPPVFSVSAAVT
jgi:photosystem II stability/assembly factor-like uncharacterized protein